MKMKKTNTKIERYKHGNYLVDIVHEKDGTNSAWLQHKDFGISSLMFEMNEPINIFLDIVEKNLENYIRNYQNEYMDQ